MCVLIYAEESHEVFARNYKMHGRKGTGWRALPSVNICAALNDSVNTILPLPQTQITKSCQHAWEPLIKYSH